MSAVTYPVHVDAVLDRPSRWLWLVKWVLAIPHYIVLSFLWLAFAVLSIAAFFAILFTGRYPRSIFEFNVGVLRWTWRVQYYAYGALGTDRYPPFTLAEVPGYPAHLEVDYPERLSRGLVLVKWWLLALPQYLVVALFAGAGTFAAWQTDNALGWNRVNWFSGGLIGLLVFIAAVILLITGRYPDAIFDFVLGMNRWVLRVAAYAGLMTDEYPPFRLDPGGHEPDGMLRFASSSSGTTIAPSQVGPAGPVVADAIPPGGPARRPGWTPARIVAVIVGALLTLSAIGFLSGGIGLLWAGQTHRHSGYITTPSRSYSTSGYAMATETIQLPGGDWQWLGDSVIGSIRLSVTAADQAKPVFVGIAPASAVARYLSGVSYVTLTNIGGRSTVVEHAGSKAPADPGSLGIWTREVTGTGTQRLIWTPRSGNWTIVAMNADGSAGVDVSANVGATLPAFGWIVGSLLAGGVVLAVGGLLLIAIPVRRAS